MFIKFDVMPNIADHTFSSEGTSNTSQTRNMGEPVSITTVTTKDDFKTKLKNTRITNLSYHYVPHQYKLGQCRYSYGY